MIPIICVHICKICVTCKKNSYLYTYFCLLVYRIIVSSLSADLLTKVCKIRIFWFFMFLFHIKRKTEEKNVAVAVLAGPNSFTLKFSNQFLEMPNGAKLSNI